MVAHDFRQHSRGSGRRIMNLKPAWARCHDYVSIKQNKGEEKGKLSMKALL